MKPGLTTVRPSLQSVQKSSTRLSRPNGLAQNESTSRNYTTTLDLRYFLEIFDVHGDRDLLN